jgi:hypothetical protein
MPGQVFRMQFFWVLLKGLDMKEPNKVRTRVGQKKASIIGSAALLCLASVNASVGWLNLQNLPESGQRTLELLHSSHA